MLTGANSGIGLEAARTLAELGAQVVMVCRNPSRGQRAIEDVARSALMRPVLEVCDVSEFRSVEQLCARLSASLPRIDVLIHNAGVLLKDREWTSDGIERSLATNLFGGFALTQRLWPLLTEPRERTARPRLLHVTSGGMYTQRLDLAKLELKQETRERRGLDSQFYEQLGASYPKPLSPRFDGVTAYAQHKRAQVLLNERWAKRMEAAGGVSHAMHPGWADTPGVQSSLPKFRTITQRILRTSKQGADTLSWLAWSDVPLQQNGKLYLDREVVRSSILPQTESKPREVNAIWEFCEKVCREH